MNKINFRLPRINRKATRQAVEEELQQLQYALLTLPITHQPKVTATLQLVPVKPSNQFHSSTEDAAIKNADAEIEKMSFIEQMVEAINRLPEEERSVIVKEYMDNSYTYNYEIYNDLGISETKYYKLKGRAFLRLAIMLKVEVYDERRRERA
ncbi:ArpU family phage packaging/lysis transcriptional regulator [Evansella clarkii]|uniref:ArpU family phage packaging/lysis transcriptional regulator n=1 Tax=Evansella clarkii TaxID=79879 RepID=UPI000B43BFE0|nr:ArpU family phage packaging/lysis transcriptional regulator [Evansella clarkii]